MKCFILNFEGKSHNKIYQLKNKSITLFLFLSLSCQPLLSQEQEQKNFFTALKEDSISVITSPLNITKEDLLPISLYAAGFTTLFIFDRSIHDIFINNTNTFFDNLVSFANPFGDGRRTMLICGAFYLYGAISDNTRAKETAFLGTESFVIAGLTSYVFKKLIGRSRPAENNGPYKFKPIIGDDGYSSLPSGHTTVAFSFAAVLAEKYDNPLIGITAYTIATLTGLSRIYLNRHWASDVFLGAVLAISVSKFLVKMHSDNDLNVFIVPDFDSKRQHFSLTFVSRY